MGCSVCGLDKARELARDLRVGEKTECLWIFYCGHQLCRTCFDLQSTTGVKNIVRWCKTVGCKHPGRFTTAFLAHIPAFYQTTGYKDDLLYELDPSYEYFNTKANDLPTVVASYINSICGPSSPQPLVPKELPGVFKQAIFKPTTYSLGGGPHYKISSSASDFKERCLHCGRNKPIQGISILRLACGHVLCSKCLALSESAKRDKKCPFFRCQFPYETVERLAYAVSFGGYTVALVIGDVTSNKPIPLLLSPVYTQEPPIDYGRKCDNYMRNRLCDCLLPFWNWFGGLLEQTYYTVREGNTWQYDVGEENT